VRLDEVRAEFEYGKPRPRKPVRQVEHQDDEPAPAPELPAVTVNGVVVRSTGSGANRRGQWRRARCPRP
jgi:hypothetical protein